MQKNADGLFEARLETLESGSRYHYRLDNEQVFPDPASRYQPEGVQGASEVVDPSSYRWNDSDWRGVALEDLMIYELHVGTFTPEGTYEGVRKKLGHLKDLGVTAIELMPLADFPGRWNWGYDPAALYAPSRAYGTPDELKGLIDAAHAQGIAVLLDVVYNHLGPDGAYVAAYIPHYFTDKHHTPWGQAVNLDDEGSNMMRAFLLENALYWLEEFHFDGLRLDATHALVDDSPQHFLAELSERVAELPGAKRLLIAEDERNLRRLLEPRAEGGYGLDAVWADDFHHHLRRRLAGDKVSYYADFSGRSADIAKTLKQGWFFTGQVSSFLGHERGTDPTGLPSERFVITIQNHDQIGNRPLGNRLSQDITPAAFRAAMSLLLFAPQVPLLFMGQEWAADTPFQYFTDHNPELGKLVSEGRKKEFASFPGFSQADVPDPQDEATFLRSKLDWNDLKEPPHAQALRFTRDLLRFRRKLGGDFEVTSPSDDGLIVRRGRYTLLVALQEGATLPLAKGRQVWTSEEMDYTDAPQCPQPRREQVYFPVPAAIIYEENA